MPPKPKNRRSLKEIIFDDLEDKPLNLSELNRNPIVIGYCRVSTSMQVEDGISLDTQAKSIKNFAVYKGLESKIFSDEGISGALYETRPGLLSALRELKHGDYFVVASLSRMSRTVSDALQINDVINEKKSTLMILDMNLDMSTPSGRMMFTMLMAVNQMERENTAQKVSDNMQNLVKQGKLKPKPPFGYKSVGKGLPFEINPEEQAAINHIRRLVNENQNITVSRLCEMMDRTVFRCRKSKKWYHGRLQKIMDDNNIHLGLPNYIATHYGSKK